MAGYKEIVTLRHQKTISRSTYALRARKRRCGELGGVLPAVHGGWIDGAGRFHKYSQGVFAVGSAVAAQASGIARRGGRRERTMNWDGFFLVCFAVGLVLSLVAVLGGFPHLHLGHGMGHHVHFGAHSHMPGHGWSHTAGPVSTSASSRRGGSGPGTRSSAPGRVPTG